jgi:hypothetical protein
MIFFLITGAAAGAADSFGIGVSFGLFTIHPSQ